MQKYIDQLIRDIHLAKDDLRVPWIEKKEGYEIDEWLSGEEDEQQAPVRTIEDWSSIKQEQLPPAERLTDKQTEALFEALKILLAGFNCNFVVHFETPIRIQYEVMRSMWQQEHGWMSWHPNFFDVCEDEQPFGTCAFGDEYCQCKKLANYTKNWDETVWTDEDDERFWDEMDERRQQRKKDAERRDRERHIEFLKKEFGDDYETKLEEHDKRLNEYKKQIQDYKDIDKMLDDEDWENTDDDDDDLDFEF